MTRAEKERLAKERLAQGLAAAAWGHRPVKLLETGCLVEGSDPVEAYLPCKLWLRNSPQVRSIQINRPQWTSFADMKPAAMDPV